MAGESFEWLCRRDGSHGLSLPWRIITACCCVGCSATTRTWRSCSTASWPKPRRSLMGLVAERPAPPALLHYRPWTGSFHGPLSSIWPITRTALGLMLRRRLFWAMYVLGLFVFLLFFFGQYLAAFAETASAGGQP